MRSKISLDFDWLFFEGEAEDAYIPDYNDDTWRNVQLPHDWSIEGEYKQEHPTGQRGGFLPVGVGWYRKNFNFDPTWTDKRVKIEFDGVYMNSEVWINGHHLGFRPNGYIGFEYDLTHHLLSGNNVIAVRVDTSKAPSDRWYTGSGIYRHVWVHVSSPIHIDHWGTYVTTPTVTEEMAKVNLEVNVINRYAHDKELLLHSVILDKEDHICAWAKTAFVVPVNGKTTLQQVAEVSRPLLWSPNSPSLYRVVSSIIDGDRTVDEYTTEFGIRTFHFSVEDGFVLNGQPLLFQGVCNHHDAGPVGAAVPDALLEKRLQQLKEMGCNAIRTSHNPFAPEFYRMCDRMGFMVMDELYDGWEAAKIPYDYSLYFEEWWERDMQDWLRRDRNHPSIILWSIGNEVVQMKKETTRKLVQFIHHFEPTRPVTCGINNITENADVNRSELDIAGYNDGGGACFIYESDHRKHPERIMIGTETPHTYQTRGFYRTQTWWRDRNRPVQMIEDLTPEELFFDGSIHYSSSYDNAGVRFSARDCWKQTKTIPYFVGEFRWSGFDYLGESYSWPARMWNHGIIDVCGFPKDHYYFYQSQWTEKPMVHLLPHWNHPGMENSMIPVWVYTNCDEAELLLNGISLGKQSMEDRMHLSWDVAYEKGTLEVRGYRQGLLAAKKQMVTSSYAAGIKLSTDHAQLKNDAVDISQVTIEIVDRSGRFVATSQDELQFFMEGPVELLGMDNGDPVDLTPHKKLHRKVFYGLAKGIFRSTNDSGNIRIVAAGILGERLFEKETVVAMNVEQISLRGTLLTNEFTIYYTLDGREPTKESMRYTEAFSIDKSVVIHAIVCEGEQIRMKLRAEFTKGPKERVVDLIHGNQVSGGGAFSKGPHATEVAGIWCGEHEELHFLREGSLMRFTDEGIEEKIGEWWYDYPLDRFEDEHYAGIGEIRWRDGSNVSNIKLSSQLGEKLVVELQEGSVFYSRSKPGSSK